MIKEVGKFEGEINKLEKNVPSPSLNGPLSPPPPLLGGGVFAGAGEEVVVFGAGGGS